MENLEKWIINMKTILFKRNNMTKIFKLRKVLPLVLLVLIFSCSKDDDPVIINLQDLEVTIDENPIVGQVVGIVQNDSNSALTYSITSQTPVGAISIDNAGEITVADATLFDFEMNQTITATVSADEAANMASVVITINNVNELNTQDFTTTVDENPTSGDSLGTVQAAGDGTLSFSISSQTPAGALSIDAATGELTIADAALFDFETNPVITANISVDNSGNTETATATINLNNVNELSIQDFTVAIDENPTNGNSLGTVQADGDGTLSFSITSQSPSGAISINSSTGELTVADAVLFDFETNPTITANISVDNSVSTETGTVTINLNDLNEGAAIGDFRDGGVVFWVDPTDNNHGLVIAMNSQAPGEWGCSGTTVSPTYSSIGSGAANTALILATCTTPGIAAESAANYDGTVFSDWFLPSRFELNEYYINKDVVNAAIIANGGLIPNQFHWSSTQSTSNLGAFVVNVTNGTSGSAGKTTIYGVRAVRAF